MRFRKPRIAWSVFWGVACVLLIVLWVRSYWWSDRGYFFTPGNIFAIESDYGVLGLVHKTDETIRLNGRILDWQLFSNPRRKDTPEGEAFLRDTYKAYPRILGRFPAAFRVQIPNWCLTVILAMIAVVPWLPRRFSLRTLVIATTLVAVVLGITIYAAGR